jgi:molybdopterin-guanine dinucleotide biosynthesis protein A
VSARQAIAGVILAGGQSLRMGEDKALSILAGKPMIERVAERLRPQVSSLAVSRHDAAQPAYGLAVALDAPGVHQGPLSGILAALRWAEAAGFSWVATAAVDTPFFPKDLVQKLHATTEDKAMAAARSGGRLHPVFGLWKTDLAQSLADDMENGLRSAWQWVARHDAGVAEWRVEPYDPFFNINTPDDVAKALKIIAEFAP